MLGRLRIWARIDLSADLVVAVTWRWRQRRQQGELFEKQNKSSWSGAMNIFVTHRAIFLSENLRKGASFARHWLLADLRRRPLDQANMSLYLHIRRLHTCGLSFRTTGKEAAPSRPFFVFWRPYRSTPVASQEAKGLGAVADKKAEAVKISKTDLKRLVALAKPEKWKLTAAMVLLLGSSTVSMAVPFSLGKVVDILYTSVGGQPADKLLPLCTVLLGVFAIGSLCNFGRVYLMNVSGQRITNRLRHMLFGSVLKQEMAFFDKTRTGELLSRLSADTTLAGQALSQNLSDGLRSGIMAIAGVSMMFYLSPKLALVGLGVVPPMAAMAVIYGRYLKKITKQTQDALADASQLAEERISNARTVKCSSREVAEIESYRLRLEKVIQLALRESMARGIFFGMTGFSGNVVILLGLFYGGTMVTANEISPGSLSAFLLYAAYVGVAVGGLGSFYSELARGLGASGRLWSILDREPALPISGGLMPQEVPIGKITFSKVGFNYPSRPEVNVLSDLDLEVAAGRVTAVVGASGSGKSTLALLFLSLYKADQGQVLLDGVNVLDLDPRWLRAHVGLVPQDPALFSGSVRDNILYGAPDSLLSQPDQVEKRLIEAAKEANALSFIENLPQGFDTELGERGVTLSGGQKQRLAIARAIVKNPRVLLLDEATSALDAESEALVQEALERVMKGRTVLTIAHRLSTIRNADSIAVLQGGRVVEQGSYDQLMSIDDGAFKKLVQHQTFQEMPSAAIQLES
ncbi:ATP-binding cassette sub-family B member 10, mitochondrial [Neocloeon triangulifer]|uniref:ATP-binding cassette sub-family B member 10, mitochondrial n=1 Tax=Neocloeon triangulifer TaxID=2078957 RepID=UPI00286ED394|nr:ATP-binding cassette sub-family B member 10, mitochondrial [Neocloeon triangulifer]